MIDNDKAFEAIKNKFEEMPPKDREKYLAKIGFVFNSEPERVYASRKKDRRSVLLAAKKKSMHLTAKATNAEIKTTKSGVKTISAKGTH